MAAISMRINNKPPCTASMNERGMLIGGMCGGTRGKHSLYLSGVDSVDDDVSVHSTWIDTEVRIGDLISIKIYDDSVRCKQPKSIEKISLKENFRELRGLGSNCKDVTPPPMPPIIYPNLVYVVTINNNRPLYAEILEFDMLQMDIQSRAEDKMAKFTIDAHASEASSGKERWKHWVNLDLNIGDEVKMEIRNEPNKLQNFQRPRRTDVA